MVDLLIPPKPQLINPAPGLWPGYPRPDLDGFNARLRSGYNPNYAKPGDPLGHKGEDLGAPEGSPALACCDMTIHFVTFTLAFNPQAGWTVEGIVPETGGAWGFRYLHLQENSIVVQPGDQVVVGQPLAHVGVSGNANYPHIHFECRWLPGGAYSGSLVSQGYPLDPLDFGILDPITRPVTWPALIHQGDVGPCVPALRGIMFILGYRESAGNLTRYGAKDVAAVKQFQKEHPPLVPDGIVGPSTRHALARALTIALN